ncbi:TIGR03618 family F420-dependent PPOX class oxidoreductase [Paractinoplanes atraurantiacus]|uniref:PPOX class probable F420-dependent enzyme n=1 Tax=Paractinoplanes atraurantiacus TaxID=1036182 RepID=A0A285K7E4_9ACTN|nr:TIGR03618 family F420-dependent PPOX class oxidoreductase [Actinoplanes atraurantiacus]SNY68495.1 PPOX class probable F420-dependent enzyme [Actinoplanes atraurantiacus]
MTAPLISPTELAVRADAHLILDATVELPSATFDGDHRATSGFPGWQAAHIPGSHHADLLTTFSDPDAPYHFAHPNPAALTAALSALGLITGTPVVVYDRAGGIWAARLWYLLDWIGIPTQVLDGGLAAWRNAGLPVESVSTPHTPAVTHPTSATARPDEPAVRTGGLTPRLKDGRWVTRDDLERWLAGDVEASVQCALNPEAFRGDVPTRYSRRGHLPGSGNLPARLLNTPDGRLLPPGQLRPVLSDLLDDPRPLWLYCGGGISAAALALALAVAGRDDVALYDGSLEEWSADPSRPLTLGSEPTPGHPATAHPDSAAQPDSTAHPRSAARPEPALRPESAAPVAHPEPAARPEPAAYPGSAAHPEQAARPEPVPPAARPESAVRANSEVRTNSAARTDSAAPTDSATHTDSAATAESGATPDRVAHRIAAGAAVAVRLSDAVRELVDRPEFAVLATAEPDGSSQLSVMWLGRDGDNLVMATKGGRRKVRNIRRDPRVTVLVHDRRAPTRYVEIRGHATVVGEGGSALVNELARRYTGRDHVIGDPGEEADRVVLRIVPERVVEQL